MTKWFCRLCWRHGSSEFDPSLEFAVNAHSAEVAFDVKVGKIPAGVSDFMRDTEVMDKLPAVHCSGDVHIGEPPIRKRYKPESQDLIFPAEGIEIS